MATSQEAVLVTLRKLELAQRFPLLVAADAVRKPRGKTHHCEKDGAALEPVIITTGGPFGDAKLWRSYPLAIDGWRCPRCQNIEFPAFLTAKEEIRLEEEGAQAGRTGDLDRAEYCFRRIVNSWHDWPMGHFNLASVYLDRVKQERAGSNRQAVIEQYTRSAVHHFEAARACKDPQPPPQVYLMLGRIYMRTGERDKGRTLLRRFLEFPEVPPEQKRAAGDLLKE
jgi:hypothetical protein